MFGRVQRSRGVLRDRDEEHPRVHTDLGARAYPGALLPLVQSAVAVALRIRLQRLPRQLAGDQAARGGRQRRPLPSARNRLRSNQLGRTL